MNTDEQLARAVLAGILGDLVDPKFAQDPIRAEAALKEAVRATYKVHSQYYPEFVKEYVKRWSQAKEGA